MSSSSRSFTIENILGLDKDKVEAKGEATTRASCENSTASHQEVPSPEPCNQATFSCIPLPIPMHIMSSTPSQITSPTLTPLTTPSLVLWPYPIPLTTSPTTHASRRRKARTVFTDSQVEKLEESFRVKKYLSIPERLALAQLLGLREQQVKTWYQNRRTKWRRELEEQDRKEALEEEAQ